MTNGDQEERFFDHFARPDPPHSAGDWEPRLRGDLLLGQILRASLPAAVREVFWLTYGVGRLILWEVPKILLEIAVVEPLRRRRFWRSKQ
jgi:hypothetical protein